MASSSSAGTAHRPSRSGDGAREDSSESGTQLLWTIMSAIPCIGGRSERPISAIQNVTSESIPEVVIDVPKEKAKPTQVTVHTSTPGGVQEKRCFSRDATVYDLRCSFREVKGKQYKLLSADGRELDNGDALATFLEDAESPDLHLTKVNILHPISLDMLYEIDTPKKDSFKCEVFPFGFMEVTLGLGKYGNMMYTSVSIEDPQPCFREAGKLEPYRLGYDYFDTLESYLVGEGRHRHRMLPARKQEMEEELKVRLPAFRVLAPQIFINPDRIFKLRAFMDKDEFPPTRENLHRFMNVFFDLLTDKSAMLL